ncbi:N-acetylmannosamine kinase [Pasteurellaceae bacterium Pebbles2]|nr:N-acetylmannosamine kinase [Pasteurellaceae bacterium Pebbles2]
MAVRQYGKILDTIGALQNSLTKTERRIAKQLLATPHVLANSSLGKIAKSLKVGEATFIRFCRTLGFKGFSDFRLEFAIELATLNDDEPLALLETDIGPDDSSRKIASKLQMVINRVVSETVNLIDFKALERVVREMRHAKRIFLFGVGSSGIVAEGAKNKLMRIGFQVDAENNNHFMYMQAALMSKGDVVIGISHSGCAPETIKALEIAQKAGAVTVAITHNLRSPITKVANFVLNNGNRQGQLQGDSVGTQITQLFVLDLIYALLVQAEEEKAMISKTKTVDVVSHHRNK